jgi:hypothetical protein
MRLLGKKCRDRRACNRARAWIPLIGLLGLLGRAAVASDWYVNAATGNDLLNNCMSAAAPCMTIQAAINKASASDTIHVAVGLYPEPHRPWTSHGQQDPYPARCTEWN